MDQNVVDFVDRIKTTFDLEGLRSQFADVASDFGFSKFAYLGIHLPGAHEDRPLLLSTYPVGWTDYYMDRSYHTVDPVVTNASRSVVPFVWGTTEMTNQLSGKQKLLFNEANEFGIRCGFTVPIHGHGGQFAGVTISTEERDDSFLSKIKKYQHELHIMALHYHAQIAATLDRDSTETHSISLTDREIECLLWATRGKTAWETAEIIGVAQSTIVFHLRNAKQKLGVYTINHAVVKAIVLNLIHP